MTRRQKRAVKGLLTGMAGGLLASWTMNEFQSVLSKASQSHKNSTRNGNAQERPAPHAQRQQGQSDSDDATMKAANKLSDAVLGHPLTKQQKKTYGPIVHYAFGATAGGLYGAAAEIFPSVTEGFGALFGAALFVVTDEIAVPALGLSKSPTSYPVSSHASALASHLVYGTTTETVRRVVSAIL